MKKFVTLIISLAMVLSLSTCGNASQNQEIDSVPTGEFETSVSAGAKETQSEESETEKTQMTEVQQTETQTEDMNIDVSIENEVPQNTTDEETNGSNTLVAYFSLAGEQYAVGVIEEGNTSIIAHMIAGETGADLFEIEAENPYPQTHDALLDVSRQEMSENARPAYVGDVENWENYDTVYIGYPNWWGDMPMIVYNFLESHDWSGKTVIPFCTHGGSGLSGTEETIEEITGAAMIGGFAISGETAQNDRETSKERVTDWLKESGLVE